MSWVRDTKARKILAQSGLALALGLVLLIVIPLIGGSISIRSALRYWPWDSQSHPDALVFWQTRLPRVLLAFFAGGCLALAGLVFQAVLRNPLAEPYILGISGGAALGRMIAVLVAWNAANSFYVLPSGLCFVGALIPIAFLHLVARSVRHYSPVTLLLAGVMLNVFFSALILLIQYFADFTQVQSMFLWMMGGLDVVGYRWLVAMAPLMLGGFIVLLLHSRSLNLLALGMETASHLGIEVRRTVGLLIWTAALLTAVTVAIAGPIGFVGLIVPHILRLLFGADHRLLVPLSALYGGIFLAVCDFLGWRAMEIISWLGVERISSAEIPVGIVTAVVGGPFFLWLLISRWRSSED
ncbi:Hemin ABC transporter, permease protein [Candidatus Sumerlaea chitinivorans]|uniref:Hemin ABC transporter, permease protein n=1 Tax=Sumerlaea chitinivorans TaxID=2250252 RepID=A0A2Z4Y592_SUMC1|nr:Hemin ABC transporter, permease protein [Candidatus Sumerlaea chitinivorans]